MLSIGNIFFSQNVPHEAHYHNCTNGFEALNKKAARAINKKYLLMTSLPKQLVQIQDNFKEIFLMMPSTKIDQND